MYDRRLSVVEIAARVAADKIRIEPKILKCLALSDDEWDQYAAVECTPALALASQRRQVEP